MNKRSISRLQVIRSFSILQVQQLYLIFLSSIFFAHQANAQCNNNVVINVTDGTTQTWTAPATGGPFSIRITAIGAGGGNVTDWAGSGGSGASMIGQFIVANGATIRAIAGAPGGNGLSVGGGGGAGSGAVNCGTSGPGGCGSGAVLIIAAGGNGDNGPDLGDGLGGSALQDGDEQGGPAGGNDEGGGGGGLLSDGEFATGSGGGGGGEAVSLTILSNGGAGSDGTNAGGAGMGGGGGGGDNNPGGGGGHSGAPGNNSQSAKSINSGTNQTNSNGSNGGGANNGIVTVVCLGALPVELIDFKALIRENNKVMLLWSTASEKDNFGYDVERSADNRNWSSLAFVPGKGTTAERHDYIFTDEKPFAGTNYYRLKQMDTDGKYQYTPMVVADVRGGGSQFDVFPNPSAGGTMSIRAVSTQEGDATLEIFTWTGLKVYKETFSVYEGTIVSPLDLSSFPKGTYTARLEMPDGTVQFKKIVLQ